MANANAVMAAAAAAAAAANMSAGLTLDHQQFSPAAAAHNAQLAGLLGGGSVHDFDHLLGANARGAAAAGIGAAAASAAAAMGLAPGLMGAGGLVDQEQVLAVMRLQQLQQLQLQAQAQVQLQQQTDWVAAAAMKGLSDASAMQGAGSTVRGGKPVPVPVPGTVTLHGGSMSVPAGGIGSSSRGDMGQLQHHLAAPLSAPPDHLMSSSSGRERNRERDREGTGAGVLTRSNSSSAAMGREGGRCAAAAAAAIAAAAEEAEQLRTSSSAPK
jgi:hypothetical protein